MKYILIAMLLVSCSQSNVERKPTIYRIGDYGNPIEVVTIDNCQYLYGAWGNATVLTHKGNCNNTVHLEHLRQ